VYNQKHITTRQLADFIQTQASVKRSDCIAVLDELGYALRHFIGLGEKVKIENVGIFKCGVRNKRGGFEDAKDLTASTLSPRILFQPEYTTSTQNGVTRAAVAMLGDITFEEATDYEAPKEASNQGGGE
jgi:predicted histone-like DNA-binding protein